MMRCAIQCPPLPYIPIHFPGELLSSWLRRTAAEFGVGLEHLAQHFGLSKTKPIDIDEDLTDEDVQRLSTAMRPSPKDIRRAMHHRLLPEVRALRAAVTPIQVCSACRTSHRTKGVGPVSIKAWFEFWQIECVLCRIPLSSTGGPNLEQCNPAREMPHWFAKIRPAARIGAARLFAFARRPWNTSLSPVAVLCLLSKPIDPRWASPDDAIDDEISWPRQHSMAELFVSGLHDLSREDSLLPTPWTKKSLFAL